jgi:polyferredoxin
MNEIERTPQDARLHSLVTAVKVTALVTLGPIVAWGNFGVTATGGLLGCPFPLPLIICHACPRVGFCLFGLTRTYLLGLVFTTSVLAGNVFCGVLCPLGIASELLYQLPVRKRSLQAVDAQLKFVKYATLFLFFYLSYVVITLLSRGVAWRWDHPGVVVPVLVAMILLSSLSLYKPWCRYFCPIGTVLSLFNRFGVLSIRRDPAECAHCDACRRACPIQLEIRDTNISTDCIRCFTCSAACQHGALKLRLRGMQHA